MMMSRSRMRRRRRRGERSNASHYKVLPPYQALQETPSTIRETLCTREYTVYNSHCDVLCSHSMTSAVRGSLEWAVEERLRLCSDVWYCQLRSFLKRNKLAGMFALQPLSRNKSWYLGAGRYALCNTQAFPLSIGIELFWRTHCNTWESTPSWLLSKSNNRRRSSLIKNICQLDNGHTLISLKYSKIWWKTVKMTMMMMKMGSVIGRAVKTCGRRQIGSWIPQERVTVP